MDLFTPALTATRLGSRDELDGIRQEWDTLYASMPHLHPSVSYEWVSRWYSYQNAKQQRGTRVWVYAARDSAGMLKAVIPVTIRTVTFASIPLFRWAKSGIESWCNEPTAFLVAPADEVPVIDVIVGDLLLHAHTVVWNGLLEGGPTYCALLDRGAQTAATADEFVALELVLPGSWQDLYAGLSRKMRKTLRHNSRVFGSTNMPIAFDVQTRLADILMLLQEFVRLHFNSDTDGSVALRKALKDPTAETFLKELVQVLSDSGSVRLYRLSLDGCTVAIRIAFERAGRLFLHLFADDPALRNRGLLTTLNAEIIRSAIAEGISSIHLCTGRRRSGLRWQPEEHELHALVLHQKGWRSPFVQWSRLKWQRLIAMRKRVAQHQQAVGPA